MATLIPATPEHLDRLYALEQKTFDEGNYPLTRRAFAYHIKKGNSIWCAFEEEKLAGYILVFLYKKSGRIYSVAVDTAHLGQGIGSELMQKALDELKKLGKEEAILEVRKDNRKAIGLYEKLGFEIRRLLPAYYGDGADGVKMALKLQP